MLKELRIQRIKRALVKTGCKVVFIRKSDPKQFPELMVMKLGSPNPVWFIKVTEGQYIPATDLELKNIRQLEAAGFKVMWLYDI